MTTWLNVPYEEKDAAKKAGAIWDPHSKRWCAPNTRVAAACTKWIPPAPLPTHIEGEDRTLGGNNLYVDIPPSTTWYTTTRNHITSTDWLRLTTMLLKRSHNRCELCGTTPNPNRSNWLTAHERWTYHNNEQTLTRFLTICTRCQLATRIDHARVQGKERIAFRHLRRTNKWDIPQTHEHIWLAEELWNTRSQQRWHPNVAILNSIGIHVTQGTPGSPP